MYLASSFLFILFFTLILVGYVDSYNITCPPGKAQFSNPNDRYSFYKCDAGGNPILFHCPAKTWFNPCLEVCDWDTGNYNCRSTISGGNSYPSNPGSNGNGNSASNHPSGPNGGSGNGSNVININININGGNTEKPNPPSAYWTERPQGQPIPPSHGGYRPQPTFQTTEGTTQPSYLGYPTKLATNQSCSIYGLLYQNPEDCSTYFMCNQRRLVLVNCSRGYFYIPERQRCETTYPNGCKFVEHKVGDSKPIYETGNVAWQYLRRIEG